MGGRSNVNGRTVSFKIVGFRIVSRVGARSN